jgi:membrane protein DedA with SNARE-associated domain
MFLSILALIAFILAGCWFTLMTICCNLHIRNLQKQGHQYKLYTSGIVLDVLATLYVVGYIAYQIHLCITK